MKLQIASKFKPLFKPKRYKVFYGGRGGAKSWAVAQYLLVTGMQDKSLFLCTREFQGSIRDSVHRVLASQIDRMGLSQFYEIQRDTIIGQNGTEFIFEGLKNNVTKIKSMEGVDKVWCEEAESITEESWDILIPTIRKPGSEIIVTFNPYDELDPTYQKFVVEPPKDSISIKVGYQDNPWFPDELRREMEECKERDYKKYLWIWEGEPRGNYEDSVIKPEWFSAAIDAHKKQGWEAKGFKSVGFDPADIGPDEKALCYAHGSVVYDCIQWSDGDVSDAIKKAFNYAEEKKAQFLVYDSVGVGTAVKVDLKERLGSLNMEVEGFSGGMAPVQPDSMYKDSVLNKEAFLNRRAQYYWALRERFENTYRSVVKGEYIDPSNMISISSDIQDLSQLRLELCRINRKRGRFSKNQIQIESKQEMEKSPNMADALMMTFAHSGKLKSKRKPLQYPKAYVA